MAGYLKRKKGGGNGCQASWHLRFFNNTFVFCIYNVCCSMNEESALERLQKKTWEEEVAKVIKWEGVQKLGKEKYVEKMFVKQRDA
jgi:hypothetical protein